MRAVLIDDERLARKELSRLLEEHPGIEVVGEAGNARGAREVMARLRPDLLFLDVQMPGETGFDLLETLDSVPEVVFVTAYDEYALRAFEVSALDYLVKPVEPSRLARTVARLLRRFGGPGVPSSQGEGAAGQSTPSEKTQGEGTPVQGTAREGTSPSQPELLGARHRVFLRDGDRCWFVELGEVRLFESDENYTRVHLSSESPLILRSLNELEGKLDPTLFFRANRAQIVNLRAVESIHPWFSGRLMAKVKGGHEVVLSRRRSRDFRERLGV
jgi:two-component system, LytTR family, response regulator